MTTRLKLCGCLAVYLCLIFNLLIPSAAVAAGDKVSSSAGYFLEEAEKIWLQAHPKIRLAFDSHYPPYSFINESGEFVGIAVDIAQRLEEKLGIEFEIYPHGQWQQLYAAAQHGQVDVIATLVKQPGRENWFEFTRPYLSLTQYVITRDTLAQSIRYKRHLNQRSIALIEGYSTTHLALNELSDITPVYVQNLEQALEMVSIGKADATIGDIGMAHHLISTMGLTNLSFSIPYTKTAAKQRYGVRKDWPQLAVIMDKALESLDYTDLIRIYSRWNMPEMIEPEAGFLSISDNLTEAEKAWLDHHPKIRLASDHAWPPFESISPAGAYSGIAADYMKLLEKKLGVEFIVSPRKPWDQVLESFQRKELDMLSCAMATDKRKSFSLFTAPYISHPMVIVTRNNVGFINGLAGLNNKTIAVEQSYASYEILSKNHPELKLIAYPDSLSAIKAVSTGKVFSYIGNVATLSHLVRESGITNIKVSGQVPYNFELSIGIRDDWPELASIIQKSLDSISNETRNEILGKWIWIKFDNRFDYSLLFRISAILSAVIAIISCWTLVLKHKVNQRTAELEYRAHFDTLTDLPNRVLVLDRLQKIIEVNKRNKTKAAVLFLDLDNFKKINDSLGHETGDLLLIEVSHRIKQRLGYSDTLSRLGGDEFIILIDNLHQENEIAMLTSKVLQCFQKPFVVNDHELLLTISVGIAVYPDHGSSTSELLRHSDTAMYNAKREGKNTYSVFNQAMNQMVARQLSLEQHMNSALEHHEFQAYYQPKVTLPLKELVGFEVLLRWHSKALGSISPTEFIPIAENNGQILKLGDFVLKEALKACKTWQTEFNRPLTISVNLSPRQFRDKDIAHKLTHLLKKHSLAGNSVELEITEGVLIHEYSDADQRLGEIQALGVKLAMDDFGTGYSSLSYLRNYHFDTLKIDREFINDIVTKPTDRSLSEATIAMAHALGLVVVAEGVETNAQLQVLASLKCDQAQGFYISKPLSFERATCFIRNHLKQS